MFICTFKKEVYEQLKNKLKLIQKVNSGNQILYVFDFNKDVYSLFSNNEIFVSNKLFFNT